MQRWETPQKMQTRSGWYTRYVNKVGMCNTEGVMKVKYQQIK